MCHCSDETLYDGQWTKYASAHLASTYDEVKAAGLVDEYRFAIDELSGVVEELRVGVIPVSRPDYAEPGCVGPDQPPSSEARSELYRLHLLIGGLRGILDRLEV